MATAPSDFVIVRPTRRSFRRQLITHFTLAAIACVCGGLFLADPFSLYVAVAVVGIVSLVGQVRAYSSAFRAIVATPDFVGLIHQNGTREYMPWNQIRQASHATGILGMRWILRHAGGKVTFRDLGVATESWGRLWRVIYREASSDSVWVDPISYSVFGESSVQR